MHSGESGNHRVAFEIRKVSLKGTVTTMLNLLDHERTTIQKVQMRIGLLVDIPVWLLALLFAEYKTITDEMVKTTSYRTSLHLSGTTSNQSGLCHTSCSAPSARFSLFFLCFFSNSILLFSNCDTLCARLRILAERGIDLL